MRFRRTGGVSISAQAAQVAATATGPVYTITRLLTSTSVLSLAAGTNANLTLSGNNIVAAAALGAGNSQTAIVHEAVGPISVEYPVVITGAGSAVPLGTLTISGSFQVGVAATGTISGATAGSTITGPAGITVSGTGTSRTYSGTPTTSGASAFIETLAGASNSPNPTAVTVAAAAVSALPAGLIARWKTEDIAPQADSTGVASWADSVAGIPALQATTASQPLYRINRANGLPSVQSDGNRFFGIAQAVAGTIETALNSGDYTCMVVGKQGGNTTYGVAFGAGAGKMLLQNTGTNIGQFTAVGTLSFVVPFTSTALTVWGFSSRSSIATGSSSQSTVPLSRLMINGTIPGGFINVGPVSPGAAGYGIFGKDASGGLGMNGEIFEVLIWNRALSASEAFQVQKAMCDKYGLAYPWAASGSVLAMDGDSISQGIGSTTIAGNYPYKLAGLKGLTYGQWTNVAIGSFTPDGMSAKFAGDVGGINGFTGVPTKLVVFEFRNMYQDAPATARTKMINYLTAAKVAVSKVAFGTSTSYGTDTAASPDSNRAAYNAYWDTASNRTGLLDLYVPLHLDSSIGLPGTSPPTSPFGPNFYDNVGHLAPAGYTILAGIFNSALTGF